jgi:hypothetical protein
MHVPRERPRTKPAANTRRRSRALRRCVRKRRRRRRRRRSSRRSGPHRRGITRGQFDEMIELLNAPDGGRGRSVKMRRTAAARRCRSGRPRRRTPSPLRWLLGASAPPACGASLIRVRAEDCCSQSGPRPFRAARRVRTAAAPTRECGPRRRANGSRTAVTGTR